MIKNVALYTQQAFLYRDKLIEAYLFCVHKMFIYLFIYFLNHYVETELKYQLVLLCVRCNLGYFNLIKLLIIWC